MANLSEYFKADNLANKPPTLRAAYSDRTAWIMAEISRLVYEKLPNEETLLKLINEIKEAVKNGEEDDVLSALISRYSDDKNQTSIVETVLRKANFDLVDPIAIDGTELIIVKLDSSDILGRMIIVAFRGTQPGIKDIFTDIKVDLINAPNGGRIHRGFYEAFEKVSAKIQEKLQEHTEYPVYFTGHSLGGALAIVATRYLGSDSTGATYTFGSPRVGDEEFFKNVKTPVYRIVNAADGVPRVPFGYVFTIFIAIIRLIPINGMRKISDYFSRKLAGYTHYGNLIFLPPIENIVDENGIAYKDLKIIKSPDIVWRISVVFRRIIGTRFNALMNDHRISVYSEKLMAYAIRRN